MPRLNTGWWMTWLIGLSIAGCAQSRPEKFPDTDIVYQSSQFDSPSVGFVNADGSNNVVLPLDFYPSKPVWSDDGKTLYFLKYREFPDAVDFRMGPVSYWREGEAVHTCSNSEWQSVIGVAPTTDPTQIVLMKNTQSIVLADIEKCQELEGYLELATDNLYPYMPSVSLDGRFVTYSVGYQVELRDNTTGAVTQIGTGINPTLSPDSQWIAYVQFDGIYMVAVDGSQERQLVKHNSRRDMGLESYETGPPRPQWSPDGQWLIYHKCVAFQTRCSHSNDYGIFKVNVSTGEEVKIVDGGVYPYWRRR